MSFLLFLLLMTHDSRLTTAFADTVYFTSGEEIKGLVVEEHHDRIVVNTEAGEKTLLRARIDEIFYSEPERNFLYLGWQALENNGFDLARSFFRKALAMNPRLEEAQDALSYLEDLLQRSAFQQGLKNPLEMLRRQWGLTLAAGGRLVSVERVEAGSLAERSGLLAGDGLVSFWSSSLAYRSPAQVAQHLLGPAQSKIKLTLERTLRLPPAEEERSWPGFKFSMERGGLTVARVEPGGVAEQAGLRRSDRVVTLGSGQATRYQTLEAANIRLAQGRVEGISLLIHRDLRIVRE